MASTKKASKRYIVGSVDGDWYTAKPVSATSPSEAVEKSYEPGDYDDDATLGEEFLVIEVTGRPQRLKVEKTIVAVKNEEE